jgi:signal transduction histidine kinase/streptogramin lyase
MDILVENDTTVWLATYNGLQIYNPKIQSFTTFNHNPSDPFSIGDNLLRFVLKDNTETMWIGTYSNGVSKLNYRNVKFPVFRNQFERKNRLPYAPVRALYEASDKSVWIGTYGKGLVKLIPKTGEILYNPLPEKLLKNVDLNYVTCIAEDKQGDFWFGTHESGLVKYNPKTNQHTKFKHQPQNPQSLPDSRIRCLFIDENETLWIGTSGGGFCSYKPSNQTFNSYRYNPNEPGSSVSDDRILTIFGDTANILWIGTSNGGLNKFDKVNKTFVHYKTSSFGENPISSNRVYSLYKDSKKRLWVATNGGLNLFDYQTESFKTFRKADGLPNDVVYGILEDNSANLWFSTNLGLCRFYIQGSEPPAISVFRKSDGLQSNEFNEGAYLKLQSGVMIFGGTSGINLFEPNNLPVNRNIPQVTIHKVTFYQQSKDSKTSKIQERYFSKHLKLPYSKNNISFEYDALHYQNPRANKVQYRLEGFDNDWINTEAGKRTVHYTNLPSGNYVFTVRASNSDGIWNLDGDSVTINIGKPFWLEWWFILSTICIIFLTIRLIIRNRLRSLVLAKHQLEGTIRMRTLEIQHQKDELETQAEILRQANEELMAQRSELEYAQSALIQSEKMASLGILTAGIAHEINNPVNFVFAGSNILKRDFEDIKYVIEKLSVIEQETLSPQEKLALIQQAIEEVDLKESFQAAEQTIKDILLGAVRAAEIVNGLKSFARGDSSEWVMYDLNKAIDGVLTLLKNNYKDRVEIVKELDTSLPFVESKGGKINQVIMNIISNAVDAIPDNGTIWIKTSHNSINVTLTIKDNGTGIPKSIKTKIFDPFFTTKDIGKGTGLGLSISYGIINEHNGSIEVESEIGKGTEFIITLPLKQDKN